MEASEDKIATPMTAQEVGQVLAFACLELVSVLHPDGEGVCDTLETLAGRFLDLERLMVGGAPREAFSTAAQILIQAEV